jgi:hypothetical protein
MDWLAMLALPADGGKREIVFAEQLIEVLSRIYRWNRFLGRDEAPGRGCGRNRAGKAHFNIHCWVNTTLSGHGEAKFVPWLF